MRRWPDWRTEPFIPQPQNHEGATFAPLLDREDGRMDFAARTATELYNRWRGFQPWPGAFTVLDGKKLIVHRMAIAHESYAAGWVSPSRDGFSSNMSACLLPAPKIRGSNSWKYSSKARSASRPLTFCAEIRWRRTRGWAERRVRNLSRAQSGLRHSPGRRAGKGHSDDLLRGKEVNALASADRNLTTTLVLGVLRWQIRLDEQLKACSSDREASSNLKSASRSGSAHFSFSFSIAFLPTPRSMRAWS